MSEFRLLMLSAMYENGGNTTHRLLDGHPQMFVYPYESQVGTRFVIDHLTSMFPQKYRWPEFTMDQSPRECFFSIIDEELKVRARTPNVSKFRDEPLEIDDDRRADRFVEIAEGLPRGRASMMEAFFRSTFDVWMDLNRSGRELVHVGYSPIIGVDTHKILGDMPGAHVLHVVRNPWSAYADTKKRAVPLPLDRYVTIWSIVQQHALVARDRFPDRFHLLRYEDIIEDPEGVLGNLCETLGLERSSTLAEPSWNGKPLTEVYPWGTIRLPNRAANEATAAELSPEEQEEVARYSKPIAPAFDYARS